MIKNKDVQIFKGTTQLVEFSIRDESGELVDISNFTGQIKIFLQEPGVPNVSTIEKPLEISIERKGVCSILLTDVDTNIDEYVYTYVLEFSSDIGTTFSNYGFGRFEIVGDDVVRLEQIKLKYGLDFSYYVLKEALNYAHQEILNNAYLLVEQETTQPKDLIKIDNFVMDSDFSYNLNNNDIQLIQYQDREPYNVVDLNDKITSITFDHPNGFSLIRLDNQYPENGYKLKVEYYQGNDSYTKLLQNIRKVEELYVIYSLFKDLPVYKLQKGLTSRTINGVTIDFDQDAIDKFIQTLFNQINNELIKIRPFKLTNVLINKGY